MATVIGITGGIGSGKSKFIANAVIAMGIASTIKADIKQQKLPMFSFWLIFSPPKKSNRI